VSIKWQAISKEAPGVHPGPVCIRRDQAFDLAHVRIRRDQAVAPISARPHHARNHEICPVRLLGSVSNTPSVAAQVEHEGKR